jgi:small-conductance mechanosensitive channel
MENVTAVVIILLILYLLFIAWNIDMTAWLASAGIIGIAIGFAAKDTIANLLSGVFILADSPYKIGDYIVLDAAERGKVTHIGLRSTRILTRDDIEINIPNAVIANGKIINESSGRHIKSRTRIPVSVAYGTDIDHVKSVLMDVASQEPQICQDPEPRVRFRQFGASGLDIELLVWIDDPEIRGRVKDSLNTRIYKRFAAEEIEIPYSKHDLYIKSLPTSGDN